jgi:hypothetical protein
MFTISRSLRARLSEDVHMAIPTIEELNLPILQTLTQGDMRTVELEEVLAKRFQLTEEERATHLSALRISAVAIRPRRAVGRQGRGHFALSKSRLFA